MRKNLSDMGGNIVDKVYFQKNFSRIERKTDKSLLSLQDGDPPFASFPDRMEDPPGP